MPIERDIYQMYQDGPFDWLNPIDMFTDFLTDGPRRSWATLSHVEKLHEIQRQYPNLSISRIQEILDPLLSK
jgi:hypothetical protein